jgi:hypothetical protein
MNFLLDDINIEKIVVRVLVILILMPLHECAHAYVAYRLGDSTAK